MRVYVIALALGVGFTASAQAQNAASSGAKDWTATIGGGLAYVPDYEGSNDYEYVFTPVFKASYRDLVFVDSDRMALGVNAVRTKNLRMGPLIAYRNGRDPGDTEDLKGMNEIDYSIELGAFVEAQFGQFTVGLDMYQDLVESHEGFLAEFSGAYTFRPMRKLTASIGASTSWASENYMHSFFGVTGTEAANMQNNYNQTNISAFEPTAGFKDIGLHMNTTYSFNRNIGLTGFVSYTRMIGDNKDSPIVDILGDDNQYMLGLTLSYTF